MTYPPQRDMSGPGRRGAPAGGRRTLIGIISGALVLIVATGTIFYLTRGEGTGDGGLAAKTFGGFEISAVPSEPRADPTGQPGDGSPKSHRGGNWRYIDDLCDRVTIDAYVSGMSEAMPRSDFNRDFGGGKGTMGCVFNYRGDQRSVVLGITVVVESAPESAKATYEEYIGLAFQDDPAETVLPGDWDQSVVRTGGGIPETTVNSFVLLENVTASVQVGGTGIPYTEAEIPGMALRTIEEMLELTSA
ncbi:hypothetical protein ABZ639_03720 [Saccharomonospora sp. NPDC006951]